MHGGGLTSSVGSETTEYLTTFHAETDVIDSMERAEGFHQMLYLNDVLRFCLLLCHINRLNNMLNPWRIEDVFILVEDDFRCVYTSYLPMVEESHTLTTAYLIEVRCRGHYGDVTLLQCQ